MQAFFDLIDHLSHFEIAQMRKVVILVLYNIFLYIGDYFTTFNIHLGKNTEVQTSGTSMWVEPWEEEKFQVIYLSDKYVVFFYYRLVSNILMIFLRYNFTLF